MSGNVVYWTLRKLGVEELKLVVNIFEIVQSIYRNAQSCVAVSDRIRGKL